MTKSSGPRTEPWGTPQEDIVSEFSKDQVVDIFDTEHQLTPVEPGNACLSQVPLLYRNSWMDRAFFHLSYTVFCGN